MKFFYVTILTLSFGFFMVGCTPMKMKVPTEFADSTDIYPVDRPLIKGGAVGRQVFKMGPYTSKDVEMKFKRDKSIKVAGFSAAKTDKRMSFTVIGTDERSLESSCNLAFRSIDVLGIGKKHKMLECSLGELGTLKITYEGNNPDRTSGSVGSTSESLEINTSRKREGSTMEASFATGYTFHSGDELVGAVDVINKGIVYMKSNLSEDLRLLIIGSATALISYAEYN